MSYRSRSFTWSSKLPCFFLYLLLCLLTSFRVVQPKIPVQKGREEEVEGLQEIEQAAQTVRSLQRSTIPTRDADGSVSCSAQSEVTVPTDSPASATCLVEEENRSEKEDSPLTSEAEEIETPPVISKKRARASADVKAETAEEGKGENETKTNRRRSTRNA